MRQCPRGASTGDARLRSLPDEQILDFLATARRGLACAGDREAPGYASAVASLELEVVRRGLEVDAPRERASVRLVLRRLSEGAVTMVGSEWPRLLAELDLPGLWLVYLYVQDNLPPDERLPALAHVCLAVDRVVYGTRVARLRYLKYVELPATNELRLARINGALEETFGLVFDRMMEEGGAS